MSHEIPYAIEPRPDTGVTNATVGVWLFIASEVMLFGALFSSYVLLRTGDPAWPDQRATLNIPLAALNTVILIGSSYAITRAATAIAAGEIGRYRAQMSLVVAAGLIFLLIKGGEYATEIRAGLLPATSNFFGMYYTMTALHALHVAAGVLVNAFLWRQQSIDVRQLAIRVRMAALYWNFIDIVWITMFVVLYLT